jgi:hypothetical protein
MPRYHFNVSDINGATGGEADRELPDLAAAHNEALMIARELRQMSSEAFRDDWSLWFVVVTDDDDAPLMSVPFAEAWLH